LQKAYYQQIKSLQPIKHAPILASESPFAIAKDFFIFEPLYLVFKA